MSQSLFNSPGGKIISNREIKIVRYFLGGKDKLRILDVGVGVGRIACTLINNAREIIGVDINRKNAYLISKQVRNPTFFHKFQFLVADGQYLPFRNSSFDAIVCIRTLKYFPNYELGLKEMVRVLKRKGILILEISNIFSWEILLHIPEFLRTRKLGLPHLFVIPKITRLLLERGFKITDSLPTYKIPFFFWAKIRNPIVLKLLALTHRLLLAILPQQFMSRGIIVKCEMY